MTEKEFIAGAIEFLIELKGSIEYGMEALDLDRVKDSVSNDIDDYLEYHHRTYEETTFTVKQGSAK